MTQRCGDAPAGPPPGGEPAERGLGNLHAVRLSDAMVEALAARAPLPDPGTRDPAARLLYALVADVDTDAPDQPARTQDQNDQGPSRRGPRTLVALGVIGPILTGILATTGLSAPQGVPGTADDVANARQSQSQDDRPGTA